MVLRALFAEGFEDLHRILADRSVDRGVKDLHRILGNRGIYRGDKVALGVASAVAVVRLRRRGDGLGEPTRARRAAAPHGASSARTRSAPAAGRSAAPPPGFGVSAAGGGLVLAAGGGVGVVGVGSAVRRRRPSSASVASVAAPGPSAARRRVRVLKALVRNFMLEERQEEHENNAAMRISMLMDFCEATAEVPSCSSTRNERTGNE